MLIFAEIEELSYYFTYFGRYKQNIIKTELLTMNKYFKIIRKRGYHTFFLKLKMFVQKSNWKMDRKIDGILKLTRQ